MSNFDPKKQMEALNKVTGTEDPYAVDPTDLTPEEQLRILEYADLAGLGDIAFDALSDFARDLIENNMKGDIPGMFPDSDYHNLIKSLLFVKQATTAFGLLAAGKDEDYIKQKIEEVVKKHETKNS